MNNSRQFRQLLWPCLLALSPIAQAGPTSAPAAFALHGGGSLPHQWDAGIQLGFPWQKVRIQYGLERPWTPFFELSSALLVRQEPSVGMAMQWLEGRRARLSGEALLGWQFQSGTLPHQGPSAALRLRAAFAGNRLMPYASLTSRHTLVIEQTLLDTASGTTRDLDADLRWDLLAEVGLAVRVGAEWGLELGIDVPRMEGSAAAIPGIHLGLQFGGGR